MKIFSFGGGVQSTAVLILQARGLVNYDEFVFANVGDDSENPETLEYVNSISKLYAAAHGIKLTEIGSPRKDGKTLYQTVMSDRRYIHMVVFRYDGMPGMRFCTGDFKIRNIDKYLKLCGHKKPTKGIGISMDEWYRIKDDPQIEYPLVNLRMSRKDCIKLIQEEGLPTPPKSSCWFCPYHRLTAWKEMRQRQPELFWRAVEMEKELIERGKDIGRNNGYFTYFGRPLDQVVGDQLMFDFEDSVCESGYCMV